MKSALNVKELFEEIFIWKEFEFESVFTYQTHFLSLSAAAAPFILIFISFDHCQTSISIFIIFLMGFKSDYKEEEK